MARKNNYIDKGFRRKYTILETITKAGRTFKAGEVHYDLEIPYSRISWEDITKKKVKLTYVDEGGKEYADRFGLQPIAGSTAGNNEGDNTDNAGDNNKNDADNDQ